MATSQVSLTFDLLGRVAPLSPNCKKRGFAEQNGSFANSQAVLGRVSRAGARITRGDKKSVTGLDRKIPLGFARRDFVRKLQATKKKRPCPCPKKVVSDSES